MLGDTPEENLALMWYDEENDWYQILDRESVVDAVNNTVSYTTTHFSKYHLEDIEQWCHAWNTVPDYPSLLPSPLADLLRPTDYFLFKNVSSYTLSVSDSTPSRIVEALNDYVASNDGVIECDIQYKNGNGGLFSGSYEYMTSSREYFYSLGYTFEPGEGIDHMLHPYMTPSTDEIVESIVYTVNNYSDSYEGKNKAIIWIVDSYVNISELTMQKCGDAGIRIYIIDTSNHLLYESIVNYQSMPDIRYYNGAILSDPTTLINLINRDINTITDTTDNDLDGLPDVYETIGMQCSNGRRLYSDPNKEDTDGDTLLDGVEISAVFKENLYIGNDTYRTIYLFTEHSDPSKEDTDEDGLNDNVDTDPLFCLTKTVRIHNSLSGADYLSIDSFDGGDQNWWLNRDDFSNYVDDLQHFVMNEDYRMAMHGCGIIAMSDLEIFLAQSYGFQPMMGNRFPHYSTDGRISLNDYMTYADYNRDNIYCISTYEGYVHGIYTTDLLNGLINYLLINGVDYPNAKWAESCKKDEVISFIISMISNNLPIILLYNADEENEQLLFYDEGYNALRNDQNRYSRSAVSHYMTIIGYVIYNDSSPYNTYLLVVETNGSVYYINYDKIAENLNRSNCNIFTYHI